MGIKVKNLDHFVMTLRVPGALTVGTNRDVCVSPVSGHITNIVGRIQTPGTGAANTVIDINRNGTTVYTATTTQITFASTTGVVSYGAYTPDPVPVVAGDQFSLDVDSISTGPANATVLLTVALRRPPARTGNITDHQDIL